jgi:hypothetical protein
MAGERESNIDEVLRKIQIREQKKSQRPINLHDTAYDKESRQQIIDEYFSTPAQKEETVRTVLENIDRMGKIKETARAGLTPEERDQEEIEQIISDLKSMRIMSEKINYVQDTVSIEQRFKLIDRDERFIAPVIVGTMKRPYRLAKAQNNIERILQSRGDDQPHK